MKRILSFIVAAMFATQAWGQTTFTIGNLKYTVTDEANHYVSVHKGSTDPAGTLKISSTVKNSGITYTVTSIESWAFNYCSGLTSVTIPNSVTSIGGDAFSNCSGLTTVTIPNSVTSIGSSAFYGCNNLLYNAYNNALYLGNDDNSYFLLAEAKSEDITTCEIKNGCKIIGGGAFRDCKDLTSITIPNTVTNISEEAFYCCRGLTSVTIGNSVTTIGDNAFHACSGLTSITIPNSVVRIGDAAFSACSGLTTVTVPSSVTNIEGNPFSTCEKLTEINVESGNTMYTFENGILFEKDKTIIISYPAGKPETLYTIPNTVTSIGNGAFRGCSGLTTVTIPNTVTTISDAAFRDCSNLS